MSTTIARTATRRPTSRQVAEAYADAVILSEEQNRYVVVLWREGEWTVAPLDDGETPEDYPAVVGQAITMHYPWCGDAPLACVGLWPKLGRSDIVQLALESGFAEQWIERVCMEVG